MKRKEFIKRAAASVGSMAIAYTAIGKGLEKGLGLGQAYRSVGRIVPAFIARPAPTLTVNRTLPFGRENYIIDPFVMLDHFGPKKVKPGEGIGVGPHPHRGFEPVTFMFEGHVEHKDSLGNTGLLDSGGVQWMTSGSGIVHSEDMCKRYEGEGGMLHGIQLWVNLPAKNKMASPGYQNIQVGDIPVTTLQEGKVTVKVVAGEGFSKKGPARTFTPILAFMIRMQPGTRLEVPAPTHYNAFTQLLTGSLLVNGQVISGSNLVMYQNDAAQVMLEVPAESETEAEILFLAGQPINEPVFSYGPFVMNSREEIEAAYRDYQEGKMGAITH
ncbi:MAG: pirin family protein [Bacteroidia bacterium]|nr:pirin family protein [Bacteroidia bacterium]